MALGSDRSSLGIFLLQHFHSRIEKDPGVGRKILMKNLPGLKPERDRRSKQRHNCPCLCRSQDPIRHILHLTLVTAAAMRAMHNQTGGGHEFER